MTYRVEMAFRAIRDLNELYEVKKVRASRAAARWITELENAIGTLERFPRRCPMAPEGKTIGRPLRHLLYGKTPHIYRIVFEIEERQKTVLVLTIRHGAREPMSTEEL